MKFAAFALFLGCAGMAYKLAVRSDLLSMEPLTLAPLPKIRSLLECPWRAFRSMPPAAGKRQTASSIPSVSKSETLALIEGAAAKYRVPAAFVTSIVAAESNFDCMALSAKGAIGLMQLMPETAKEYGVDPAVPAENIDGGTHYLHWLMERYRNRSGSMKRVIAAYNAGPGMVDRYHGVPPFRETRTYVVRVLGFLKRFSPPAPKQVAGNRRAHAARG